VLQNPVDRCKQEGEKEAVPGGAVLRESCEQAGSWDGVGDFEIEHEEGHDYGEDGVAKSFDPVLAEHASTIPARGAEAKFGLRG